MTMTGGSDGFYGTIPVFRGFTSLMDRHLPGWPLIRQTLNAAPLAHANWLY